MKRLAVVVLGGALMPCMGVASMTVEAFESAALNRCIPAVLYNREVDVEGLTLIPKDIAKSAFSDGVNDVYQVGVLQNRVFLTVRGRANCKVEILGFVDDGLDRFGEYELEGHSFPFTKIETEEGQIFYVENSGAVVRFRRTGSTYTLDARRVNLQ